ncbi:hypothetical protein HanPSC8_Chr14g0635841 [Helianthus annuus]|nr:hypothetical protein HanPSC8_Chr14g0635841 [Helianthus annuus]
MRYWVAENRWRLAGTFAGNRGFVAGLWVIVTVVVLVAVVTVAMEDGGDGGGRWS